MPVSITESNNPTTATGLHSRLLTQMVLNEAQDPNRKRRGLIRDVRMLAINKKKCEIAVEVEEKKKVLSELRIFVKSLRFGAKAVFGDDSLEYQKVGGKRRSDYKRPSKKKNAPA